jgi:hypothetical protein
MDEALEKTVITNPPTQRTRRPIEDVLELADSVTEETDRLLQYRNLATGIAGAGVAITTISSQHNFDLANITIFLVSQILLIFVLSILILLWYFAITTELAYLQKWVRVPHYKSKRPFVVFFTFVIIGFFLSIVVANSNSVHIVLTFFACYLVIDIYSWILRRKEIGIGIGAAVKFLNEEKIARSDEPRDVDIINLHMKALDVLSYYYFKRPNLIRLVLTLIPFAVLAWMACDIYNGIISNRHEYFNGIVISVTESPKDTTTQMIKFYIGSFHIEINLLRAIAYLIAIIVFCISEFFIASWRNELGHKLSEFSREQFELVLR